MGEEWGASMPWQFFTSHPEPERGRATAEGRLAEFVQMGWNESVVPDPRDPETYLRSRLDWSELADDDHARLLALHRELIDLRRATPELSDPSFAHTSAASDGDDADALPESFRMLRGPGIHYARSGLIAVCAAFAHGTVMHSRLPGATVLLTLLRLFCCRRGMLACTSTRRLVKRSSSCLLARPPSSGCAEAGRSEPVL